MKQTAVEWLANELYEKFEMKGDGALFNDLVNQAKEMEEQQRDELAIAFAEYVLDWNRDTTSDYLQIILEQFKNK